MYIYIYIYIEGLREVRGRGEGSVAKDRDVSGRASINDDA